MEIATAFLHLSPMNKQMLTILDNINGVIKLGRMTLLPGLPGAGKTTLLLMLALKVDDDGLRVKGNVTYNGHNINEFVVAKTAA